MTTREPPDVTSETETEPEEHPDIESADGEESTGDDPSTFRRPAGDARSPDTD